MAIHINVSCISIFYHIDFLAFICNDQFFSTFHHHLLSSNETSLCNLYDIFRQQPRYHFALQQVVIKPHLPIHQSVDSIFLPGISYTLFLFGEVYNSNKFLQQEMKVSIYWGFLHHVSLNIFSHSTDIVCLLNQFHFIGLTSFFSASGLSLRTAPVEQYLPAEERWYFTFNSGSFSSKDTNFLCSVSSRMLLALIMD